MTTSGSTNKVAVAACPFCGGTDTACGIADEEFGRFWVECICGARGPTVETLKDARPAWNKRLAPEPGAGQPPMCYVMRNKFDSSHVHQFMEHTWELLIVPQPPTKDDKP